MSGEHETLEEAIKHLRRDPSRPIRARLDGLTVELRAVGTPSKRSAAEAFDELGPWEGESTEEVLELLSQARREGGGWAR